MNTKQKQLCFGILLVCVVALNATRDFVSELTVSNGQRWGNWGAEEFCPEGQFAYAYSMKIEGKQGKGDDTSLNGIRLYCRTPTAFSAINSIGITSSVGPWGDWTEVSRCGLTGEFLTAFKLQVESPQGDGDDTAANFVKFQCRGSSKKAYEMSVSPGYGFWGDFGFWSAACPDGSAICGMRSKVEERQGSGDDTALNDVLFYCCTF